MISILLACYNGEKYIEESIKSILNQSFEDFELLIGFNGTTDNSRTIAKSYKDSRIRIFDYGNDKGKAKTLNKLLNESSHDFICLQDHDDIWICDKLEKQIQYLECYDVIGTYIEYINDFNKIIGKPIPDLRIFDDEIKEISFTGDNQIANTTAIFKKSDALQIKGWQEDLDGIEDFDFWLKLMKNNKKFMNIPKCLVFHRLHENSNFNIKTHDISKIL